MIGQGNGFGVSFMPNGDQRYRRPGDQPGGLGGQAPLQEAIKILSMRVPRVVGANPMAPQALLTGPGASGLQPGQLEQLMRTLGVGPEMQMTQAPGAGGGPGPVIGGAPSPMSALSSMVPTGGAPQGGPVGGLVSVTAGVNDGGAPAPAPTGGTLTPRVSVDNDSEALYELARRQRDSMGRISY